MRRLNATSNPPTLAGSSAMKGYFLSFITALQLLPRGMFDAEWERSGTCQFNLRIAQKALIAQQGGPAWRYSPRSAAPRCASLASRGASTFAKSHRYSNEEC